MVAIFPCVIWRFEKKLITNFQVSETMYTQQADRHDPQIIVLRKSNTTTSAALGEIVIFAETV